MRLMLSRLVVVLAIVLGVSAYAEAQSSLSGHVRDLSGNPVPFATVEVLDAVTGESLYSDGTTETGSYAIFDIVDGTYDVRVTPTPASGFIGTTAFGVAISGATTLDFALASSTPTTFSGRILDLGGTGIPNQSVQLIPEGGEVGVSTTTDATGAFEFNVQTGSYFLLVNGDNQSFTAQAPQLYTMQTAAFDVSGGAVVDFVLPVTQVTVHVQDGAGNAVAGATVSSSSALNCELTFGPAGACGSSNYDDTVGMAATTDAAGNAILFLLPTPPSSPETSYSITATPPAATGFAAGIATGVQFASATTVTITVGPPTVLTGRLLDGTGAGIPNQVVELVVDGQETGIGSTTNGNGEFTFAVQPGTYRLNAFGDNQGFTSNAPQSYAINSGPFTLSNSQAIDFQLPVSRVDVHVQNAAMAPVANAGLSTTAVSNCGLTFGPTTACGASNYTFDGSATTDASGDMALWLFPTPAGSPTPSTSYRLTATPPAGSGSATTSLSNVQFTTNTSVTITLANAIVVTGQLRDRNGAGIGNQFFEFVAADTGATTSVVTDAAGNYTADLQVGQYSINAFGDNQNFTAAAPLFYSLSTATFQVVDAPDQVINLQVPATRLIVHVQDGAGNPLSDVGLSAIGPTNCALVFGPAAACGNSQYFYTRPGPGEPAPPVGVTDSNGDLTLWLFNTPAGDPDNYNLTATPLADSGFAETTVSGVTLTADATLVIVLNATHAAPVTTLDISPAANGDGTYPDPVTITLSATAAAGFSVDATFYEVDNTGVQQYSGPFQVTGPGPHNVRYFSVDDDGVSETPQTFNFTIALSDNTPPVTTATVTPDANAAGWHNTDVIVDLNAVDEADGSGVQSITYAITGAQATPATVVSGSAASIAITTEGVSTITFWATDNAGNTESAQTLTVRLDKTAPTIGGSASPAPNANGWNSTPVTVTFTCSDGNSGLAAGSPPNPTVLSTEGVDQSATGTCTDLAGNSASATVSNIDIDLTAPEAYTRFEPATKDIVVFGRDSLSGTSPAPVAPSSVVLLGPLGQIRTYNVTDTAGNVLQLVVSVKKTGQLVLARVISTKYDDAPATPAPFNLLTFTWTLKGNGALKTLDQLIYAGSSLVQGDYNAGPNKTVVTRWLPLPIAKQTHAGLVLLRTATASGQLVIEY
jgi:hypothetical protein